MASVMVTYFLWLFLGIFGVHHFYLKRDRHAFVWWATFGGFFMGWLRDFLKIPDYVEEANENDYVNEGENVRVNTRKARSEVSGFRFGGMLAVGYLFGSLVLFCCPEELYKNAGPYKYLLQMYLFIGIPIAVATGGLDLCKEIPSVLVLQVLAYRPACLSL